MMMLTAASGQVAYSPVFIVSSEDPLTPVGVVKGRVTTADGRPGVDVSVVLPGTNRATLTDEEGRFELKNLKEGSYALAV